MFEGRKFTLEARMVGAVLELAGQPAPPTLQPKHVSLKEETEFLHASPEDCLTDRMPVVIVCHATHDIKELSLPLYECRLGSCVPCVSF